MNTIQDIIDNCVITAREDHSDFGLWGIAKHVKEDLGIQSLDENKRVTMQIVEQIMGAGILPCDLAPGGHNFWTGSIPELMAKVEAVWPKNRLPNLGNPCWFYWKE